MAEALACPICNRRMTELVSYQRDWRYFKHPGRDQEEVVIVGPEQLDVFGSFDEALANATDALHFDVQE